MPKRTPADIAMLQNRVATHLAESEMRAAGGGATHSAGWDWVVPLLGIVAIAALVIGRWQRPHISGAVFSVAVAAIDFALATAAALGHWLDLMSGSLSSTRWVIHPAPAVAYFAAIAMAGMVATLILLGSWLHQGNATDKFLAS